MASNISRMKREIRKLNAQIDTNLRSMSRKERFLAMQDIARDPHYPNATIATCTKNYHKRIHHTRLVTLGMIDQLHEMQRAYAIQKKVSK